MNLYPDQMKAAIKVCEALNKLESALPDNFQLGTLQIMQYGEVIGECRDDDGVGYSFHPATEKPTPSQP